MHIVHVAPEMAPYAKVGGLGDVAAALPVAQAREGHRVSVVLPGYHRVMESRGLWPDVAMRVPYRIAGEELTGTVHRFDHRGVDVYVLWHPRFFDRPGIYGESSGSYQDNADRFGWFCGAAINLARALDPAPDVFVCHDWPAALAPVFLRAHPVPDDPLAHAASVFVIHNLAHQGVFPAATAARLGLPGLWTHRAAAGANINLLRAVIRAATLLVTVSPTYAQQILAPAHGRGLDGDLRARSTDLFGILNGLDVETWDPATDALLPATYHADDLSGKAECKRDLQRALGFRVDPSLPLFGTVSRIDAQKGIDLIGDAAPRLVERNAQVVVLGTGQPALLDRLQSLASFWKQSVAVVERFDEEAAHRIYAGSDFFLMPSRFEPCGLGQLVALRYGTPPVVHRTGGLADTVRDADVRPDDGNGFAFDVPDAEGLAWACGRAMRTFAEAPAQLAALRDRGMREDLSWTRSAREHLGVCELAVRRERRRVMDG